MSGPNLALTDANAAGCVARPGGAEAGIVPVEAKDVCDAAALIGAEAKAGIGSEDIAAATAAAEGGSACACVVCAKGEGDGKNLCGVVATDGEGGRRSGISGTAGENFNRSLRPTGCPSSALLPLLLRIIIPCPPSPTPDPPPAAVAVDADIPGLPKPIGLGTANATVFFGVGGLAGPCC